MMKNGPSSFNEKEQKKVQTISVSKNRGIKTYDPKMHFCCLLVKFWSWRNWKQICIGTATYVLSYVIWPMYEHFGVSD
jgi:hypothetical protein